MLGFIAFSTLSFVGCGSDDEVSGSLSQSIEKVISIVNAQQKSGSIPQVTTSESGVTTTLQNISGATSIIVNSPVELTKFFVSVSGIDGYLECPATLLTSRAGVSTKTYTYTISILLASGINQNVTVVVNAETVDGDVVYVMKEKLDVKNEENVVNEADALIGTWNFIGEQITNVLTVTKTTLKYVSIYEGSANEEVLMNGNYEFNNGFIFFTNQNGVTEKLKPSLLADNNVLVLRSYYTYQDSTGNEIEASDIDNFELFVKQNAKLNYSVNDLQGTWIWHFHGNQEIVRSALILKDNTFDMIIPIWGQRMTGTFTYNNGYIDFKVTNGYVRHNYEYDESLGAMNSGWINVKDADPNDYNLDLPFGERFSRPFIPQGNVAYSNLANLPVYYEKQ